VDRRGEPHYWRAKPWNGLNRPVVGVCWYEAQAYTQWLTRLLQGRPSLLPAGVGADWTVALPSEAEWEKAVRGPKGLIYPWGERWKEDAANIEATDLNTTSPVGLFPRGESAAFGLLDGVGNVWEWTRSLWGSDWQKPDFHYPYDPKDPGREALDDARRRVVRGGSFSYDLNGARCAYRVGGYPVDWLNNCGFRLCLRP
jgi:formylglycine-generating enzyme required for sulfatase activity